MSYYSLFVTSLLTISAPTNTHYNYDFFSLSLYLFLLYLAVWSSLRVPLVQFGTKGEGAKEIGGPWLGLSVVYSIAQYEYSWAARAFLAPFNAELAGTT